MWSSRLFWKLFLAYAALVLLVVCACVAIVSGWQEEQLVEQVRRRLHDSASLLCNDVKSKLSNKRVGDLQELVRHLGSTTNTRFTLVANDGLVLADSEQPTTAAVAAMENHLGRVEFVNAKRDGGGFARRVSPTLGLPYLYYALAAYDEEKLVGFVRAAQPLASILEEAASIQRLIGLVGIIVAISGLVVTYLLTHRIVQPVQLLTSATQSIASGNFPQRISIPANDELGLLARSFEQMGIELTTRENQLRESMQRQSTILSGMIEGVLAVDQEEHVLFANQAAGRMLGFAPNKIEQRALLEVVRSNDLREIVQKVFATKELVQGELELQTESLLTLEVHATPLPGNPCPGVILVLDNISELKRLESVRQQFIANVSHELKTPLSSIKAYAETLLRGAINDRPTALKFLSRIDDQANRLNELVLDMLTIGRIESGQKSLEFADIPLNQVVGKCISEYETRAEAVQISLEDEISSCSTRVHADEEALQQILNNLLDNALKCTPAGGTISLHCREEEGEAVIAVSDTGVGIAPHHHARLFERFYRVDKARSREQGGTGLGLAIVKHLSQAMGGSVSLESAPQVGSIFTVRIPLAK